MCNAHSCTVLALAAADLDAVAAQGSIDSVKTVVGERSLAVELARVDRLAAVVGDADSAAIGTLEAAGKKVVALKSGF